MTSGQKSPRAEKINRKNALEPSGNHCSGAPIRVAISEPSNSPARGHQRKHRPIQDRPPRMLGNLSEKSTHRNKYSGGNVRGDSLPVGLSSRTLPPLSSTALYSALHCISARSDFIPWQFGGIILGCNWEQHLEDAAMVLGRLSDRMRLSDRTEFGEVGTKKITAGTGASAGCG